MGKELEFNEAAEVEQPITTDEVAPPSPSPRPYSYDPGTPREWVYIMKTEEMIRTATGESFTWGLFAKAFPSCQWRSERDANEQPLLRRYPMKGFYPAGDAPTGIFNTFKMPDLLLAPEPFGQLLPELDTLLKHVGGDERRYLEQWLRYCVDQLGEPLVALIVYGAQGTGKDTLATLLKELFGKYHHPIGPNELDTQFNSWIVDKLLITANEICADFYRDKLRVMNNLKLLVNAGEMLTINGKFQHAYQYVNRSRWLIFSNNPVPILLDSRDRRYSAIKATVPIDPDVAARIRHEPARFAKNLLSYLLTVDMAGFKPTRPNESEALKEIRRGSRTSVEIFWDAQRIGEAKQHRAWYSDYKEWCVTHGEHPVSDKRFKERRPLWIQKTKTVKGTDLFEVMAHERSEEDDEPEPIDDLAAVMAAGGIL